jgi:hypothetical protein
MIRRNPDRFAQFAADQLRAAPVPPADVLNRPITKTDVTAYSAYFILGPGRDTASTTLCAHGYYLTDSCPGCDADDEHRPTDTPKAGTVAPDALPAFLDAISDQYRGSGHPC